jgi:Cu(I)/Ag(I) efflux system membrane fusion protein
MQKLIIIVLLFFITSCNKKTEHTQENMYYTCSMDPQVMESKPGKCPICKMPLTPVKKDHSEHVKGLHLSDQQVELGHIKTETLTEHEMGDEILLTGVLTVDQNKISSISSRVMGRIEKLYFKNTGEKINSGDVVYEIYSEDLNLAARELKLALEKKKSLKVDAIDLDKIINSVKNKLRLYGLIDKQIEQMGNEELKSNLFKIVSPVSGVISNIDIKEGDYAMEGGSIYHVADYSNLWAETQVFIDDLSRIKENTLATVYFPGISGLKIRGKVSFVNPELNSSSQINIVRIEIPNNNTQLKVGMQVNASFLLNKKITLALPTDAIIIDAKGSSVWIKTGHNQYQSVMVTTGMETNEYTQITSGLNKGDTVVISGAYLLRSEYLFKKGTNPMEGHDMSKMK